MGKYKIRLYDGVSKKWKTVTVGEWGWGWDWHVHALQRAAAFGGGAATAQVVPFLLSVRPLLLCQVSPTLRSHPLSCLCRTMCTDDWIPCSATTGKPIFAKTNDDNAAWVLLLEKAMAKFKGSYAA